MIKFLNWLAGLRPTPRIKIVQKGLWLQFEPDPPGPASFLLQPPPDAAAAINRDLDRRIADGLMRRHGSNSPAPGSKPEPPAVPPSTYLDGVLDPTPLQTQILAVCHGMKLRADAEKAAAAQLREIAESLVGAISAEQGSIPLATDFDQAFATAPRPQPTGGRLFINDIEQPKPTGSETLLEMVEYAIAEEPWEDEAKGAVLAVARWLRSVGNPFTAEELEREASK